jgi:tRNA threonylcarbamoyl adenosine modification protein YeaZ
MELAIDTSTDYASVALSQEGNILTELTWHSKQQHTVELVPNIQRLFEQAKIDKKSIGAVFIAKGPGSFNGLRVGMSTAKGLAFALNIPILAISTLEIEACPFAFTGLLLCPIHGIGRGEIAAAFYRQEQTEWKCLEVEHITTVDVLCGSIVDKTVFCGEIPEFVAEELQQKLGEKAVIPEAMARLRHASYLAMLGFKRLKSGERDNAASMQPLYLRQPPITKRKVK